MSALSTLSLKNRALIALITIGAAVFGSLAMVNLKQELIPPIELPTLMITTSYPGASPVVVESDVSTPIETAIQGVPGLETTSATSATNLSLVRADFTYGVDLVTAEQKIQQAISRISRTLPDGVQPQVLSLSIDDLPVIQVAVSANGGTNSVQDQLAGLVVPALEDLPGVAGAQLVGATGNRVTITPDPARLAAAGMQTTAIQTALQSNGILLPGGDITEQDRTLTVQTGAKIADLAELRALPLGAGPAGAVTLADVADVEEVADPVTTLSRVNGEAAITIAVTKTPAANTVEVSRAVTNALGDIEQRLPSATFTVIFDQAPFITSSIDTLATEGMLGLAFAVVIILVFLLSLRSTIVTGISIPTSVLVTFIGMQAFGYSLNLLTLGALTISIGRVVDDSIVVIENIKRHYVDRATKGEAIRRAVAEVAGAVTASTVTTVAVFLPIAFVGDLVGELFRPFAVTVTMAMAASLLVALTIVPVLAYWFMRPARPARTADGAIIDPDAPDAPPSRLQRAYRPVLSWTLRHSAITLILAVLVLVGTGAVMPLMKLNFLGDSGQNTLTVSQSLGEAASLDAKDAAARTAEAALEDVPGVTNMQVSVGSSGSALRDAFQGGGDVTLSLTTDPDADQATVRADVQRALDGITGAGEFTLNGAQGIGSSTVTVEVSALGADNLQQSVDAVTAAVEGRDGIGEVTNDLAASLPYLSVTVDRAKAASVGLSETAVGAMVSSAMQPQQIGRVEFNDTSLIVYLASENPPTTLADLRALMVPTLSGVVRLDSLAVIEEAQSPASISTARGLRTATVSIVPAGDNLAVTTASVTAAVDSLDLPDGARASVGGVSEQQTAAFGQLGLAMLAAIVIVYVVMVATFKSLRQPLLLLVSVPFAATGAVLLQVVTGVPLGVASLIGVLMLIGIVVTNAIVLVDLVNQYRERGLSAHDATLAGSSLRLRPILMTALATIFALTPMALGITGHGGFISQPLAIVVIGGLVSSTLLTLIVLPTLYNLVEGAKERRRGTAPRVPTEPDAPDALRPAPRPVTAAGLPAAAPVQRPLP